jgi:hypothetical protein
MLVLALLALMEVKALVGSGGGRLFHRHATAAPTHGRAAPQGSTQPTDRPAGLRCSCASMWMKATVKATVQPLTSVKAMDEDS